MSRIVIIVATPDASLERIIVQRREQLIPDAIRRKTHNSIDGNRVTISCFLVKSHARAKDLIEFVDNLCDRNVSGIILAIDYRLVALVELLRSTFFVISYSQDGMINFGNFFGSIITRALRDYRILSHKFDDTKFRKLFTLPLRNFKAPELNKLVQVCAASNSGKGFADRLDAALRALRERQKPKRYEDNPSHVYLVDDEGKHFQLGHERHARAETAIPPHNDLCRINNVFRFGHRFDSELHYNVSKDENSRQKSLGMIGSYLNCHDSEIPGQGRTHLNMFPNDFF